MLDASRQHGTGGRLPRTFRAFQNRGYSFLWPVILLSNVSRFMQITLLAWLVLDRTDSPWLVALIGFFALSPMLFLGLVGGILADLVDRRRLLTATQVTGLMVSLAMTAILATDNDAFWHAYVVVLLNGSGFALEMPARRSLIYDLLGRSGVTNGFALDSVAMSASRMIGPALAGALILLTGFVGGYITVVLFYSMSIILLWKLGTTGHIQGVSRTGRGRKVDLLLGLRYVRGQRTLLAVVMVTLAMNLFLFPYMHLVPVIARDVLHVDAGLMGLLQATDGLGSIIGAVALASLAGIRYHGRLYLGGSVLALVALFMFSFSSSYFLSLPLLLLLGFGTAAFGTMQATIVLLVAREEMRGAALGVISLAIGSSPLGALLVGAVADMYGPGFAIRLIAGTGIVCLVMIAALMSPLRRRIVD